ncbi:MAG: pbpF 1 [Frankiales bacterium]|nr:pbpF 1 [Frankiales bacterium]
MARALLVGVLALVVGGGTFVAGLLNAPINLQLAPPPQNAILVADDGRQIALVAPPEKREEVDAKDIPPVMRLAIINAEDERFLKHNGVDPLATVRALLRDVTGGNTQGGSTLTQQYVKNAYVGNERTAMRKIREAALAYRLEQKLTKQQILTDYLNALYLGNGLYGVQAASKYYFGVPVKDLDLNVAAHTRDASLALSRATLLAGIAPAPSAWNPIKDFRQARVRQTYTLNQMVKNNYITAAQATKAFAHYTRRSLIQQNSPPESKNLAPEFVDYVVPKIKADPSYDEDTFFRGGLKVKTTLNLDLQQAFAQALKEVLPNPTDPQAALVAVDYQTGGIKAMSTLRRVPPIVKDGKVVNDPTDGYKAHGFNLATNAARSSGSTIKTFTLATALVEGHSLGETRFGPSTKSIPCAACKGGAYVFSNAGDGEAGTFTLQAALAHSVNTIYVPLANDVGRDKVAKLAERAGLAPQGKLEGPCVKQADGGTYCPPAHYLPFGIGGGVDVTPLGEATGYATFANGGRHIPVTGFTEVRSGVAGTGQGQLLFRPPAPHIDRVVSKGVASDVVKALTSVVDYGTATSVQAAGTKVFGKTGTTNDSTDAWFTGCVPELRICMSSWMGNEYASCTVGKGKHVNGTCGGMHDLAGVKGQIFGGTAPARIFTRALQLYKQIKSDRELRAAGVQPSVSPSPGPTRHRGFSSATPAATTAVRRTSSPKPVTTVSAKPTPANTPKPPVILPTAGRPSPTGSPP